MARIDRVNEEIRQTLSALLGTVKDPRVRGLVTVVRVNTTPDFKQSKVYISVLNDTDSAAVLKGLSSASGFLRRELGKRIDLRNTPELIFIRDESIKQGAHIYDLLQSISTPGEQEGTGDDSGTETDNND